MIDNFSLALSHGLILLACWRLLTRDDLDDAELPVPAPDSADARPSRWRRPDA